MRRPTRTRLAAAATVLACGAGLLGLATPTADAAPAYDTTSAVEKRRVDRVPTPKLDWYDCQLFSPGLECATADLPLDYDRPTGGKTEVAVLRRPADDQKNKIGSLFINPGGPGGSGTQIAALAELFISPAVLARFDIVGFDPRGTNFSDNVACFASRKEQVRALTGFDITPVTAVQRRVTIKAAQRLGQACSTTGKPLSNSMSTAQVARDMDVLRRAVGDKKLTYLGFSYGSYLGQVYAGLFPDRVRALALDGVVDPVAWRGTNATGKIPQWDRLRSADGASKAFFEILKRCDAAGPRCVFSDGDPVANTALIAQRLRQAPLRIDGVRYDYGDFVNEMLSYLYDVEGAEDIAKSLAALLVLTARPTSDGGSVSPADRSAAVRTLKALQRQEAAEDASVRQPRAGFPYDNSLESFSAVSCTDSKNDPRTIASLPAYAAAADKRAPYFGAIWVWNGQSCPEDVWRAPDEDTYKATFAKRTIAPILFVGNYWDPATNVRGAVRGDALAENSALLLSDSWGHTAYGTSACATGTTDTYLLTGRTPVRGTVCVGDYQPFTGPQPEDSTVVQKLAARGQGQLWDLGSR